MRTNLPGCHWTCPGGLILALLSAMLLVGSPPHAQAEPIWQINTLDNVGAEENDTALALDATGYPVISYFDTSSGGLKLLHCNDANCSGNDESIQVVDSDQGTRKFTALALDVAGYPVISYFGWGELKLAHCNDANCSGHDESIQVVDSGTYLGSYNALVLDAAGYPVISYFEYYWNFYNGGIKLAHCNDANCSGHDESIQTVDGAAAFNTALALDAAGHPVVSYSENSRSTQYAIQLAHCNDANCKGHTSITYPDPDRNFGFNTSLVLDAAGSPVISYDSDGVRLVHCNDVNCSGDDESSQLVANTGLGIMDIALALDAAGYPVISYAVNSYSNPATNGINLVRCNDVNCNSNDENSQMVDSTGVGSIALVLDATGYPVISYYGNSGLKLARLVDLTPPGVTINQADGQVDPTTNPLIHFTVIFTEAVTGFVSDDITLEETTGATTITVNEQAPYNGTTYDVIISGMTSSGTVAVSVPAAVATDLSGNSNTAALSTDNIVTFVLNHSPIGMADSYPTDEDTPLMVANPGVRENDSDPDADAALTAVQISLPTHGTVTLNGDGSFNYIPSANYYGTDSFHYQLHDSLGAESYPVTVTLQVAPVNDPPMVAFQVVTTSVNQPVSISLTASDIDSDRLSYILVATPQYGTLVGNAPDLFYTPNPNFSGTDQLTFQANDGQAMSKVGQVAISIIIPIAPTDEQEPIIFLPLVIR